jgi:DNA polymerase-1
VVHANYRVPLRTGRTACSGPNVQQVPRDGLLRRAFVPRPGHLLLAVDYSFIELRTLAAVCLKRYGRSVLADVIGQGGDPHVYTAALVLGVDPGEFAGWKDDETVADVLGVAKPRRKHYKEARQAAKAVNFGVPGGLGAANLVAYGRQNYGIEMTVGEAGRFRDRLIGEVYPELSTYLVMSDNHFSRPTTIRIPGT